MLVLHCELEKIVLVRFNCRYLTTQRFTDFLTRTHSVVGGYLVPKEQIVFLFDDYASITTQMKALL